MDRNSAVVKEFEKIIIEVQNNCGNPYTLYSKLSSQGLSKLECMVVDSAVKGMPIDRIANVYLILPERIIDMFEKLTYHLANLIYNRALQDNTPQM